MAGYCVKSDFIATYVRAVLFAMASTSGPLAHTSLGELSVTFLQIIVVCWCWLWCRPYQDLVL